MQCLKFQGNFQLPVFFQKYCFCLKKTHKPKAKEKKIFLFKNITKSSMNNNKYCLSNVDYGLESTF